MLVPGSKSTFFVDFFLLSEVRSSFISTKTFWLWICSSLMMMNVQNSGIQGSQGESYLGGATMDTSWLCAEKGG